MPQNYHRRATCRLCSSKKLKLVLDLVATPVGDAYVPQKRLEEKQELYPLGLYVCKDCGHAQLVDIVNPNILYENFTYHTAISYSLVEHFRGYANDALEKVSTPKNSLVVDVGSNDGSLLKFFKERGMKVLGVDPAKSIAVEATAAGVETLPEFFNQKLASEIKKKYGSPKIITTNNTMANIDDLTDIMEGIKILLDDDGALVFETGYGVSLVQNKLVDVIYHEHLGYFSASDLNFFLRKNGLELFDIQVISSKGGSLRGFAQKTGGPRKISSSVKNLLLVEKALGVSEPEFYAPLAQSIEKDKKALQQILASLKKDGKKIAGFGASVGVTTLLYHYQLVEYLDFLVDDNKIKQGTFSPGFHLPVLHPRALEEKKPDYILILSWRYAEPIMKKYAAYRAAGGHFILPLPHLSMV